MDNENIIYEQPLNERVRLFLRLDHLFQQITHGLHGPAEWDSRLAVVSLIELLAVLERADAQAELLKELDRHATVLTRLEETPGVNREALDRILQRLSQMIDTVSAIRGRIGQRLAGNEMLASVRQRSSIPGGTCNFDMPVYHHWLRRPAEVRAGDLEGWLKDFEPLRAPIALILDMIRQSAGPEAVIATGGFFQKSLDPNVPYQMVRVALPLDAPWYPEISAGKHRVSIRFLDATAVDRPQRSDQDIPFELSCCVIVP